MPLRQSRAAGRGVGANRRPPCYNRDAAETVISSARKPSPLRRMQREEPFREGDKAEWYAAADHIAGLAGWYCILACGPLGLLADRLQQARPRRCSAGSQSPVSIPGRRRAPTSGGGSRSPSAGPFHGRSLGSSAGHVAPAADDPERPIICGSAAIRPCTYDCFPVGGAIVNRLATPVTGTRAKTKSPFCYFVSRLMCATNEKR